ncbi:MAG: hypothetical protein WAM11_04980 [Cyanobium sp.]
MRSCPPAWRPHLASCAAVAVLLGLWLALVITPVAQADTLPLLERYRCDGDPLTTALIAGAVDAAAIPNTSGGTVPGAVLVLQWRDISLQLPRTNNAGAPSFSDGKWWWSLEDPGHPSFRLRRGLGDVQTFACQKLA